MMANTSNKLTGYLFEQSVLGGDTIRVAADSQGRELSARLVRLNGPTDEFEKAPWWSATAVEDGEQLRHSGHRQETRPGSFGYSEPVASLIGDRGLTFSVWFWVAHQGSDMTLLSQTWEERNAGLKVFLTTAGRVAFAHWSGEERLRVETTTSVRMGLWQGVTVSVDTAEKKVQVLLAEKSSDQGVRQLEHLSVDACLPAMPTTSGRIVLGAVDDASGGAASASDLFDGKIDRPRIWMTSTAGELMREALTDTGGVTPTIEWLFGPAAGPSSTPAFVPNQRSGAACLTLVNRPEVCVTGHRWTGDSTDVRLAPREWSALRLHSDDLADAAWETTFSLPVPETLASDIYAVELQSGEELDLVPFFVRPSLEATESKILYVAPTMTYLAYGNDRQHTHVDFGDMADAQPRGSYEEWVDAHPEFGSSLYDLHPDGSGWSYSSPLRPLGNVRPDYVSWITGYPRHFSGDLAIVSWLRDLDSPFDVVTDHDVHKYGASLLERYKVVVTGSHPEYVSREMLDAFDAYVEHDGRLMYLGGNGFYWATAVAPDGSIEVRRGHAGSRAWESLPGEDVLSLTLEPGGLWRHRGRSPNALVGVGFAAQGWTGGAPYVIASDLPSHVHKLVFGGLKPGARVGEFGGLGGAAGDEVDRFDIRLGSPTNSVVLASSARLTDGFQPAIEDHMTVTPMLGGSTNTDIRADMTYVKREDGGAVFSVGSINWGMCLPVNNFDNEIARISTNVLNAFIAGSL